MGKNYQELRVKQADVEDEDIKADTGSISFYSVIMNGR